MKKLIALLAFCAAGLALCACAGPAKTGTAAQAIETYIKALVSKNKDSVVAAACAKYESDATLEADSFAAVTPTLDGLACTEAGTQADATLVNCKGTIKVTYNGEAQSLPLDGRTYLAVQENGDWRMCGYK